MKKLLSLLITVILVCTAFSGCVGHEVFEYQLQESTYGVWGSNAMEPLEAEDASLTFKAGDKDIIFVCNGKTYTGELRQKSSMQTSDTWKVFWDEDPEDTDEYEYSFAAFYCSSDYKNPSPFVKLCFYYDGEENSMEASFNFKYAE